MFKVLNVIYIIFLMSIIYIFSKIKIRTKTRIEKIIILLFLFYFYFKELGLDYEPYKKMYENLHLKIFNDIFKQHMEPLVVCLVFLLKRLGLSYKMFFLILGGIPLILNYKLIKKQCKNKFMGIFIMFYLFFFIGYSDAMRQLISSTIYLFILENKSKIKRFFLFIIGIGFHYSLTIVIIIKYFLKKKWKLKTYLISLIICGIISIFIKEILIIIIKNINSDNQFIFKLKYYLIYQSDRYKFINIIHKILWYINNISFPLGMIFMNIIVINRKLELNEFKIKILNSSIIGTLIYVIFLFSGVPTIGARIILTLSFGMYLLIEDLLYYRIYYYFIIFYFAMMNGFIFLYYIGIHDPKSIFFIL